MKKFIINYITRIVNEKVGALEDRIFKSKKEEDDDFWPSSSLFLLSNRIFRPISLEEEIMELQDKVDVLSKKLGGEIVKSPAKEEEFIFKTIKEVKSKK
jgi:hypothetical protein